MTNQIETTEQEAPINHSRVKTAYKVKYAERATNMKRKPKDIPLAVLKRCNGDWLALELARRILTPKSKLDREAFITILKANGIDNKWADKNNGLLRMSGGLALRAVVADNGELIIPDEGKLTPPRTWVNKYIR